MSTSFVTEIELRANNAGRRARAWTLRILLVLAGLILLAIVAQLDEAWSLLGIPVCFLTVSAVARIKSYGSWVLVSDDEVSLVTGKKKRSVHRPQVERLERRHMSGGDGHFFYARDKPGRPALVIRAASKRSDLEAALTRHGWPPPTPR